MGGVYNKRGNRMKVYRPSYIFWGISEEDLYEIENELKLSRIFDSNIRIYTERSKVIRRDGIVIYSVKKDVVLLLNIEEKYFSYYDKRAAEKMYKLLKREKDVEIITYDEFLDYRMIQEII